jgi:hypothetical protein
LAILIRGSVADLTLLAVAEGLAAVGAVLAALAAASLKGRALWLVAPVSLVLWALALLGGST